MSNEDDPNIKAEKSGSLRNSQDFHATLGKSTGNGKEAPGSTPTEEADSMDSEHATSSKTSSLRSGDRKSKNVSAETMQGATRSFNSPAKSAEEFFPSPNETSRRESNSSPRLRNGEKESTAKHPPFSLRTELRRQEQRLCQKRFREMIGKRELRRDELGKRHGDLRQRLDLLECSVPAVMVWNIWRMVENGQTSGVQRALEKHFRGPGSGEAVCPSTPSRHYDCRVREAAAERKEAQRRTDEARTLWTERSAMLEEKRRRLDEARRIQEERKKRIGELNDQVSQLREAFEAMEKNGSCEAGECGDMRCKERLLSRVSSTGSIKSTDVECLERLQSLAEAELSMKRQIADLERREDAYMKTLQQADELWAKAEGDTTGTLNDLEKQLEMKTTANQQLAGKVCQLEDELESLRSALTGCRNELEKFIGVEKTEALIGREDDVAYVSDKSVAARVKIKHRPVGQDDDLADIFDKDILVKQETMDEEILAVIERQLVDEETLIASDLTETATDVQSVFGIPSPTDQEPAIRAELLGDLEDPVHQEQLLTEATEYLAQLDSLGELYREDDYGVCGPQHVCYEDFPSEEGLSIPAVSTTGSGNISEKDEEKLLGITSMETTRTSDTDEMISGQETPEQFKDAAPEALVLTDQVTTEEETVEDLVIAESEIREDGGMEDDNDFVAVEVSPAVSQQLPEEKLVADESGYDGEKLSAKAVSERTETSSYGEDEAIKDTTSERAVRIPRDELLSWLDVVDSTRATISKCPDCSPLKETINSLAQKLADYAEVEIKDIPEGEAIQAGREIKGDVTEGKVPDTLLLLPAPESDEKPEADVRLEPKEKEPAEESISEPSTAAATVALPAMAKEATGTSATTEQTKSIPVDLPAEVESAVDPKDPASSPAVELVEESFIEGAAEIPRETDRIPVDSATELVLTPTTEEKNYPGVVDGSTAKEMGGKLEDEPDATEGYIMQKEIPGESVEEIPVTILQGEEPSVVESEMAKVVPRIDSRGLVEVSESFVDEDPKGARETVSVVDEITEDDGVVHAAWEAGDQVADFVDLGETNGELERSSVRESIDTTEEREKQREMKLEEKIDEEKTDEGEIHKPSEDEVDERVERKESEIVERELVEMEREERKDDEDEGEEKEDEEKDIKGKEDQEEIPVSLISDEEPIILKDEDVLSLVEEEEFTRETEPAMEGEAVEIVVEYREVETIEILSLVQTEEGEISLRERVEKSEKVSIRQEIEKSGEVSFTEDAEPAESLVQSLEEVKDASVKKESGVSLKSSTLRAAVKEKLQENEALGEETSWDLSPRPEAVEKEIKEVEVGLEVTVTREEETTEIGDEEILISKQTETTKTAIVVTMKELDDNTVSREVIKTPTEKSVELADFDLSVKPYLAVADIEKEEKDMGILPKKKPECICQSTEPSQETIQKSETVQTIIKTETSDMVSQTVSSVGTQTTLSQVSKRSGSSRILATTVSTVLESKVSEPLTEYRERSKNHSPVTTAAISSQTERPRPRETEGKSESGIRHAFRSHQPSQASGAKLDEELRSINYQRVKCNCCSCGQTASRTWLEKVETRGKPVGQRIDQRAKLCPRCRAKRQSRAEEIGRRIQKPSKEPTKDQPASVCPVAEPRFLFRGKLERRDQSCTARIRRMIRTGGPTGKERRKSNKTETVDVEKISPVDAGERGNDEGGKETGEDWTVDCVCYETIGTDASGLMKRLNCSCGDSD